MNFQVKVHRLVAEAFIPNPENKPEVNHKDGIKNHNYVSNLEWVTKSENILHAFRCNLKSSKKGAESHLHIYDEEIIKDVCIYLSEGILTLQEISNITSVSFGMIYLIAKKKSWTNISKNYNIDNYYRDREAYNKDQYEKVFKLLEDNRLSLYDISDISGIKYSSINNIMRKVSNPLYNDLYKKYDINNYKSNDKRYSKEIPSKINDEIIELINKEIKPKYIKRILAKKYKINEEAIRVYMRKF